MIEAVENSDIGRRNKALLVFMYASGARAQEVCDIKVGDIIFTSPHSTVILHGKWNKSRELQSLIIQRRFY